MATLHVIAADADKAELRESLPVQFRLEADPLAAPDGSVVWLRPGEMNLPPAEASLTAREHWEKLIHRLSVRGTVVQLVRAATFDELLHQLDSLSSWQSEVRPRVQSQARGLDLIVIVALGWEPTEAELRQLAEMCHKESFPLRGATVYWLGSQLRVSWSEGTLIHARSVWSRLVATLLFRLLLRTESGDGQGPGWFAWRSLEIRGSLASSPARQVVAGRKGGFAERFFDSPGDAAPPMFHLTITPPRPAVEDPGSINQNRLAAFTALGESSAANCVNRDLHEDQFEAWRQQTAVSFRGQLSKCHRMLTSVSADRGQPAENVGWSLRRQWEIAEEWRPDGNPPGGPGYFARLATRLAGLAENEWNTTELARTQFRDWQKSQSQDELFRHRAALLAKAAQLDLAHKSFVGLRSRIVFATIAVLIVAFGVAALVDVWASFWLQSGAWSGGIKRWSLLSATLVFSVVGSVLGALLPYWLELRAGRRGGRELANDLRRLRETHQALLAARAALCCRAAEVALKNRAAGMVRHAKSLVERASSVVAPVIQEIRLRLTGADGSQDGSPSHKGPTERTGDWAVYEHRTVVVVPLLPQTDEPKYADEEAEVARPRQAADQWGELGKRMDPERTGRLPHLELSEGVRGVVTAYEKALGDTRERAALDRLASPDQLRELVGGLAQRLADWMPAGSPTEESLV